MLSIMMTIKLTTAAVKDVKILAFCLTGSSSTLYITATMMMR